jgi:hypothetical protein
VAEGSKQRERTLSLGRDFLIRTWINKNAPSIVDHMFFFLMETSSF